MANPEPTIDAVLFTNLCYANLGNIRLHVHALALMITPGVGMSHAQLRGFGCDPALEVFDHDVRSIDYELGAKDPRTGKYPLVLEESERSGLSRKMVLWLWPENPEKGIDIFHIEGSFRDNIRVLWAELERRTAKYALAPARIMAKSVANYGWIREQTEANLTRTDDY